MKCENVKSAPHYIRKTQTNILVAEVVVIRCHSSDENCYLLERIAEFDQTHAVASGDHKPLAYDALL